MLSALKLHYPPLVRVHLNSVCKNTGKKVTNAINSYLRDHNQVLGTTKKETMDSFIKPCDKEMRKGKNEV